MNRAEEIAEGLRRIQERVANACAAAERDPDDVTIVVVTKTFPASDLRVLADLGVRHVAENRAQELRAKAEELAGLGLIWHFIGQLQRNKAAVVAQYADVIESLDRAELIEPLARAGGGDVLIQVSLDEPPNRGGVPPAHLQEIAAEVAATPELRLRGLMAIAPYPGDPAAAFGRLAELRPGFLADHPEATVLSAGMSGDLEEAIHHGATQVRVGGAILGNRAPVQ